ncbi:MAG: tRNA adenosine(34) deaminase TadA [Candidatus Aminicenantes bacterium]|nr:tRNA adenosine(34) deaminase TadA [Candidatus Aminicenantes bacterium]
MKNDEYFMQQALLEAALAKEKGEVPVGAVLVADKKILTRGYNSAIEKNDPTSHAEIVAIRRACEMRSNYRIPDCELYVTLEPCAMCLGAAVQARIRRLVFGAYDPKAGAAKSIMHFPFDRTNHHIEIRGGLLAEECGQILKDFFKDKR